MLKAPFTLTEMSLMLVLDPHFFAIEATPGDAFGSRLARLKSELKKLLMICQSSQLKIAVERKAWKHLEINRIRPIVELAQDHELNVALSVLRQRYIAPIPETSTVGCRTWGIKPLFNGLQSHEDVLLANAVTASILYIATTKVASYFFICDEVGRTYVRHSTGHSTINEIVRWRVYLTAPGLAGPQHATCMRTSRNLAVPWTTRYDAALPDAGKYCFRPPPDWFKRSTQAVRTIRSKPAFVDERGNGWVDPNTPGISEHWDLLIEDANMAKETGLDQLNVWKYLGASKPGGEIHHVPGKKMSKLH